MPWNPGDHITLRYVGHHDGVTRDHPGGLLGWPFTVVQDSPDLLALWMPRGTERHVVDMADRTREVPGDTWRAETLRLMFPGKPYSIWLFWGTETPPWVVAQRPAGAPPVDMTPGARRLLVWYVNLEAPFVRTPIGFDTTDNSLDLVVLPDHSWHWKDEHLTQRWIDVGAYTREETDQFYADGRAVIADVEARRFPFDGSWLDFRPDPAWTIPTVAPGWDVLPGYDVTLTTGRRLPWTDPPRP